MHCAEVVAARSVGTISKARKNGRCRDRQRVKSARQTVVNAAGHRAWRAMGHIRQDVSSSVFAHALPASSRRKK
jgi:hypothetical protein